MLVLSLFCPEISYHGLRLVDQVSDTGEYFLIVRLRCLELLFETLEMALVKLVEDFHLERPKCLPPDPKFFLNVLLQLLLLRAVVVSKAPVVLWLTQFSLRRLHFVQHLPKLVCVFADQRKYFLLFPHIVALMSPKEGTVRAHAALAPREADELLGIAMLSTDAENALLLLLLLLLNLHLGLGEAVLKVH